jgi:Zn-dependent peptidase ImmA (M78 family)/transcriptional regulator with XRE-family HTH domain
MSPDLFSFSEHQPDPNDPVHVAAAFDPARLTQARRLAVMTKAVLAAEIGVSAAAIGQYEAGSTAPRPDHLPSLGRALDVPVAFFASSRPHARLDATAAHFRSLRSTPAAQRAKAIAFVEQMWELSHALERRVQFPAVDLPDFSGGEVIRGDFPTDPAGAAEALRSRWNLGIKPVAHLVRLLENHGVVVALTPFTDAEIVKVSAFSTTALPRPVIVLTPDRIDDVYYHRFTAAHELGHLLLHAEVVPGDVTQEREADMFAAEFLTPRLRLLPELPDRVDFRAYDAISKQWGVSIKSLIYRSRELGKISDSAARRAYQRLNQLHDLGFYPPDSVTGYPGETPSLLAKAFALAETEGLTLKSLAKELSWSLPRLRLLLDGADERPKLHLAHSSPT